MKTILTKLATATLALSLTVPAMAQTKIPLPIPAPAAISTSVQNFIQNADASILADFQNASALAHAANNVLTMPCWDAWVALLSKQQTPAPAPAPAPAATSAATPASPAIQLITGAEKVSELVGSLQPGGSIQMGCAALADATKKSVLQLVGTIATGGIGAAMLPVGL
jgi:hypothetical protein